MALQSFTWNNGTVDNPVSLNTQQLASIVNLASQNNITKDVRGHITTSSGMISKYEKYVLNQAFPNLIVHATEIGDSFSLVAGKSTINEGDSTIIAVTGLATSAVDFALEHTITGRSGIEENAIMSKIRMEGNYLVVDAPQENASWRDVVRVKAKPIYEEWSNSSVVRYVDVTVVAIAVSGITLSGVNKIGCGNTAEISVGITPATSTKLSGLSLVNSLASTGSLPVMQPSISNGIISVTAPAEQCNLTLTTNAYLFGDMSTLAFYATKSFEVLFPHIRFVVTTDGTFSEIVNANPKITLQKVNENEEPIGEAAVITGSTSGNSLVYEFGYAYNNGVVRGDGSEKFIITAENVKGYTKTFPPNVIPNDVDTIINATYNAIQTGIYVVYSNGDEESSEDVLSRYGFASGKTVVAFKLVTSYCTFAVNANLDDDTSYLAEPKTANIQSLFEPSGGIGSSIGAGLTEIDNAYADGVALQSRVDTYISNNIDNEYIESDPIYKCYNKKITIGGVQYNGYVGIMIHYKLLRVNQNVLSQLFALNGKTNYYPTNGDTYRCVAAYKKDEALLSIISVTTNLTSNTNTGVKKSLTHGSEPTNRVWISPGSSGVGEGLVWRNAPIYFIP